MISSVISVPPRALDCIPEDKGKTVVLSELLQLVPERLSCGVEMYRPRNGIVNVGASIYPDFPGLLLALAKLLELPFGVWSLCFLTSLI